MIELGAYKDKFSRSGQRVLEHALSEARRRDQNCVSAEHILNALAFEESELFNSTLFGFSVGPGSARKVIEQFLQTSPRHVGKGFRIAPDTTDLFKSSMEHARSHDRERVAATDILSTLLQDENSLFFEMLRTLGINQQEIMKQALTRIQELEQLTKQKARIFLSYRRNDSVGYAGRLSDRLSDYFGEKQLFIDVNAIRPGEDFINVIEQAVGCCEVLIAIIGKDWLTMTDPSGRRLLDNPEDFVRVEIASALSRNIRVIPVLVNGATMPRSEELPDALVKLARRNAVELSDARWKYDVDRLIKAIESMIGPTDN